MYSGKMPFAHAAPTQLGGDRDVGVGGRWSGLVARLVAGARPARERGEQRGLAAAQQRPVLGFQREFADVGDQPRGDCARCSSRGCSVAKFDLAEQEAAGAEEVAAALGREVDVAERARAEGGNRFGAPQRFGDVLFGRVVEVGGGATGRRGPARRLPRRPWRRSWPRSARSGRRCRHDRGLALVLAPASWPASHSLLGRPTSALSSSTITRTDAGRAARRRARSRRPDSPAWPRNSPVRSAVRRGEMGERRRRAERFGEPAELFLEPFLVRARVELRTATTAANAGIGLAPSELGVAVELARVRDRLRRRPAVSPVVTRGPVYRNARTPGSARRVRAPRTATRRGRSWRSRDRRTAPRTGRCRRSRTWPRSGCVETRDVPTPGGAAPSAG